MALNRARLMALGQLEQSGVCRKVMEQRPSDNCGWDRLAEGWKSDGRKERGKTSGK